MKSPRSRMLSLLAVLVVCATFAACTDGPAPVASSVLPTPSSALSTSSASSAPVASLTSSPGEEEAPAITLCHLTTLDLLAPETRTYVEKNVAQLPVDYTLEKTYKEVCVRRGAGTLSWYYDNVSVTSVALVMGRQPDLADGVSYPCAANSFEPVNLIPGTTYYWQIVAETESGPLRSEIASFTTLPGVRPISIAGVGNARDLGGWATEDGLTLKYGRVFRTAKLTDVTAEGVRTAVDDLGIKTEIDLRGEAGLADCPEEGVGPLGRGVNYINFTASQYKNAIGAAVTVKELRPFCDPANYPVLFHCAGGADRAGTLASLLEGICGCSPAVLVTDYELTDGRWRTYQDYEEMMAIFEEAPGDTFREKVWGVLRKKGLTPMELSNIRSLLTGDGAVFASDSLTCAATVGDARAFKIDLRQSGSVASVTLDGSSVDHTFSNGTLTLQATSGEGKILFDDGTTLYFVL